MATLVHAVDKEFYRYSTTRNLDLYFRGVLHIVRSQDGVSMHGADLRSVKYSSFDTHSCLPRAKLLSFCNR